MNDMQFNFLVKVAQTKPDERQGLLLNPDYQIAAKKLGGVSEEVLGILLGTRRPGNLAKAWISLVTQTAAERTSKTMNASKI
jgi:hypothetical protein